MFNINRAMQFVQQMQNPQQMLMNMGIPQEHLNSPENAMKYLIDSGKVTQQHVDQVTNLYNQFHKR